MQSRQRKLRSFGAFSTAIVLASTMAACESIIEAVNPCAAEGACEVDGVDLAMAELKSDAPEIAEIGMPAVPVGSTVNVNYTVRNRGSEASSQTSVSICVARKGVAAYFCDSGSQDVEVNSLKPGERKSGTVAIILPPEERGERYIWARAQRGGVVSDNDELFQRLLIERPNLTAAIQPVATELKAGTALRTVLTVRNPSHVAGAAASRAEVCIGEPGYSLSEWACQDGIQPVPLATPALDANATRTDTIDFMVPLITLSYPDDRKDRDIIICADATDQVDERDRNDNCARTTVTVLPNLDQACTVDLTAPGQSLAGTFSAGGCDLRAGKDVDVYAFQGSANATYALSNETEDGVDVTVYDERGTRILNGEDLHFRGNLVRFTVAADAEYHIVVDGRYSSTPGYRVSFTQQ